MARDWIKMRVDLPTDPAVIAIAEMTGLCEDTVVGKLHRFWSWADQQTNDGHAARVTKAWLDRYVNGANFAQAMICVGWLDDNLDGITIPKFDRHNGQTGKARALAAKRAARKRAASSSRPRHARSVTRSLSYYWEALADQEWIPEPLRCDDFGEVWDQWVKHRSEIKKPLKETQVRAQLKQFGEWGYERAKRAIEHTIAKGWQGIREPESEECASPRAGQRTFEQIKVDNTKEAARKFAELMDAKDAQRTVQHGS